MIYVFFLHFIMYKLITSYNDYYFDNEVIDDFYYRISTNKMKEILHNSLRFADSDLQNLDLKSTQWTINNDVCERFMHCHTVSSHKIV